MHGGEALAGRIDPASDRAVFRQIADPLRDAIERGRLREGDRLPSESRLMDHYGVARMTVRNALQALQAEGLVVSEHGRGVFVRPPPACSASRLRQVCASTPQGRQVRVPPRDAMEILGHSRISVTMEIYTHADDEAHRDALDKIGDLFDDQKKK